MLFTLFLISGYLCGSLSSAILYAHFAKLPDPRTTGSGNPGATNILRLAGKRAAAIVLILDSLKGFVPVAVAATAIPPHLVAYVGLATVIGHLWPIFFHLQGGKGVATALGALLALNPATTLVSIVIWVMVAKITRFSSLASLTMLCSTLILNIFVSPSLTLNFHTLTALIAIIGLIFFSHRENIQRLLRGEENKL